MIEVSEKENQSEGAEQIITIINTFLKQKDDSKLHLERACTCKIDPKSSTPRHNLVKLQDFQELKKKYFEILNKKHKWL